MKDNCAVCGKNTMISSGFHLEGDLNFCGNVCISKYVEIFHKNMIEDLNKQEKRIQKLEKKLKSEKK